MTHSTLQTAKTLAQHLLAVGAIKLSPQQPFRWASGWFSPIYCDNRLVLSYPIVRNFIKEQFASIVRTQFPHTEVIAGVATAGVPHGALLADVLDLPFIYVRPKPKEHGMGNLIEGKIDIGKKVLVVEDLISTGGSSVKAAKAIGEAGMDVIGMVAIFTYGFEIADQTMQEAGITLHTLCNYTVLIEEALTKGYIAENELVSLQKWRQQPSIWKQDS